MAKQQKLNTGSFPTQGQVASAVDASATPSRNTKDVAKHGGVGGMLEGVTANYRKGVQIEKGGASHRITAKASYPNAPEASLTERNVRIVPSALGSRDFWDKRNYGV